MSKKNNKNQHLNQRIREQQAYIDRLKLDNKELRNILREMQENKLQTFADVMLVLFEQFMMCDLTEEQAGKLMVLMTSAMLYTEA